MDGRSGTGEGMMPATVTLFRPAAIESRAEGADAETLAVDTPWSWSVFALAAAIITTALLLGILVRVERTGRARGAVVPVGGERAELVQTSQEIVALEESHQARRLDRQVRIAQAAAGRSAARVPLGQLVVRAGASGTIESLAARAGDVVATGAPLGRIVPDDVPLRIVCFLRQDDRRFVRTGAVARIELDELPKIEFGTVPARVIGISRDLATDADVHEVLAGTDPLAAGYRVELEPLGNVRALRAGMLLRARFVLGRERPLALLFAPLRRWAG